jgi:hypothetical protein
MRVRMQFRDGVRERARLRELLQLAPQNLGLLGRFRDAPQQGVHLGDVDPNASRSVARRRGLRGGSRRVGLQRADPRRHLVQQLQQLAAEGALRR